ncbi:MAG: CoA ester lyase [Gammaproteobacteria bacterium]|nr:CoA ester lyase [Gammaproteobacteria bacterium]MDH4316272.1 CoA ester lyase [Gammaproteobacteria bacterium]MDH5213107.1 CoA ester lyase [Gammaproteobacteria bacterium]MDH5500583.1 CoA ester lyase [Gammaproteobacteria bacterium]
MSRSYLFVPGDSERKLAKALDSGADALIVDLEDSVARTELKKARRLVSEFLSADSAVERWVRINPLDSREALDDLRDTMPGKPAGIVLPKPSSAADVVRLGKLLDVLEQENAVESGATAIMPIATERPGALFRLQEYAGSTPRLMAMAWGAEDLATALGASANRDENGNWLPTYQLARSLCLIAASAAGVAAIDTVYTDYRDDQGLELYAGNSRRDGFRGMLAIHPAQVATINNAFMPDEHEIERARKIVELFEASPHAGTLGLDGQMLDRPHLLQARRILQLAAR